MGKGDGAGRVSQKPVPVAAVRLDVVADARCRHLTTRQAHLAYDAGAPAKYETAIKALDLEVPPSLLARAQS